MHPRIPYDLWELQRTTFNVIEKTADLSVADLEDDYDIQLIVERVLERIGETPPRIRDRDPEIAAQFPAIQKAIDQRNLIAHEYYEIDWDLIHRTLNKSIPELQEVVDQLIADHPEDMKL